MKKHLSRIITGAVLILGALVAVGGGNLVLAQESTTTTNNLNTLKIAPVRTDITIQPGETKTIPMKVTNLTKIPMTIRPVENDFVAGDEKGTPALILDENEYAPTHSLKRFMLPMKDIVVPPESTEEVKLTIKVPADAQAGGYFGAVRFVPVNPDGTASVNLNASAASLVLMTVPGDLVEKLDLTNFSIKQGDKTDVWFQSPNDLHLSFRFANQGNVQVGPVGTITVKQGDKVLYKTDFNKENPRAMILPDSARQWEIPLKEIGSFGNYTVTALFTYGGKNETIEVSKSFWVIPWTVIIGVAVAVLVLIGLIVGIWLFLRSYKRRILNNSHRDGLGRRR